jgi:hypothetical protein
MRFADFVLDSKRNRLVSVVEDHTEEGEERNYIAAVDLTTGMKPSPTNHPSDINRMFHH